MEQRDGIITTVLKIAQMVVWNNMAVITLNYLNVIQKGGSIYLPVWKQIAFT